MIYDIANASGKIVKLKLLKIIQSNGVERKNRRNSTASKQRKCSKCVITYLYALRMIWSRTNSTSAFVRRDIFTCDSLIAPSLRQRLFVSPWHFTSFGLEIMWNIFKIAKQSVSCKNCQTFYLMHIRITRTEVFSFDVTNIWELTISFLLTLNFRHGHCTTNLCSVQLAGRFPSFLHIHFGFYTQ